MKFVNNWTVDIVLAQGATQCELDLPDGDYRLTLSDSLSLPTRWEIVVAEVAAGTATLVRAQEGTADQPWAEGSIMYCSVTAGVLSGLFARVGALESAATTTVQQIADLLARVEALESSGGDAGITITSDSSSSGGKSGYSADSSVGAISPPGASVYPGGEAVPGAVGEILSLVWTLGELELTVRGDSDNWPNVASLPFTALTIGATEYLRANLEYVGYSPVSRTFVWDPVSDPFVDGENSIVFS